jgi:flagellar hook protein FlgE
MDTISDNIANVNTVGFKSQRANFTDVLGGIVGASRVGRGSMIASIQTNFTQGSLLGTGVATDLALRGEGFFVVSGSHQGVRGTYFTRAGQFRLDGEGYLITDSGLKMQGYNIDSSGSVQTSPADLQIAMNSIPPSATSSIEITANLDASQAIDSTPFDIADPSNTSDYATSMTVYDSLGSPHQLQIYFKKLADTPAPQWEYHVVTDGADVDPPPAGPYELLGSGTLDFNTDGSLDTASLASVNASWKGAITETITIDVGTGTSSGGSGLDGITTYASPSATTYLFQDGYGSGDISGLQIGEDGTIEGMFTNGQRRVLGQLVTARFASNEGLERRGAGLYAETLRSGAPVVGAASTGGRGTVTSGSLESSNVDIAAEFVNMIAVQRGFQSNSRTITTADDMLSEIVQLKR